MESLQKNLLLSIIIPVYNVELYLEDCISSVFEQDLNDCEVICVDDGSTDRSSIILDSYIYSNTNFPCPFYVFHKLNGGASSARNYGIGHAKGQYLCFVDSDDTLLPNALKSIKEKIRQKHADIYFIDGVITQYGERIDELRESEYPVIKASDFYHYTWMEEHRVLQGFSVCYIYNRLWFLNNKLHYHEGIVYEDFLLQQEATLCDGCMVLVHVEQPTYCYKIFREGAQTAKGVLKNFKDRQYVARYIYKRMRDESINDLARFHSLYDLYISGLHEAFISGNINRRKEFFDNQDLDIMRHGILTLRERNLFILLKCSIPLACKYRAGQCRPRIRRIINIFFSSLNHFFPNRMIGTLGLK